MSASPFYFLRAAVCLIIIGLILTFLICPRIVSQPNNRSAWDPLPIYIRESRPVEEAEARFVAAIDVNWQLPGRIDEHIPIATQLRITNNSNKDILFPTFDTLTVKLAKEGGPEIHPGGGRDWTNVTRPIVIPAGSTFSLAPQTELRWDRDNKIMEFVYQDGTGAIRYYGPLKVGKYTFSFEYDALLPPNIPPKTRVEDIPEWRGRICTPAICFEIQN